MLRCELDELVHILPTRLVTHVAQTHAPSAEIAQLTSRLERERQCEVREVAERGVLRVLDERGDGVLDGLLRERERLHVFRGKRGGEGDTNRGGGVRVECVASEGSLISVEQC